jgi:hypothetical protein
MSTGARSIAAALAGNTTLTTLRLAAAGVGDDGARHFALALRRSSALRFFAFFFFLYYYLF